ncbi:sulfide:quinone oxidoreductase [Gammaproteobacteria bacterium]
MKNIVVAGASFAGLSTIQALRKNGCSVPITLVAPQPAMLYYPSLIWVPTGLRNESDITIPLTNFFRRYNVNYVQGSVTGLDAGVQRLRTTAGEMEYERLVIATGGHYVKKLPGIEHAFIPCEGYRPVAAMKERLDSLEEGTLTFGFAGNPNEPAAMRGGPLFEFLFGIDTLLRRQKRRDRFDLVFFTPAAEPGKRLGARAMGGLMREMERRGIRGHVGHKLKGFAANRVITEGGDLPSDLIVFIPGMVGPNWAAQSGLPLSTGGFVCTDGHCRVPGFEGSVYVAGDAGSFPGPDWMPKQAHLADLQAHTLARNLIGDLAGKRTEHTFRAELICVVDTLDNGILVFRNAAYSGVFKSYALHWSKRLFEWMYLNQYRPSS